jgi:glycerol-3-phosphate dehydrogenase subunit C
MGVDVRVEYPGCCGMPQLELGNIPRVAEGAVRIADFFESFINDGYTIISLVPSCSLMIKGEWPLIHPGNENIQKLQNNTKDISEYIVALVNQFGLTNGISSLGQDVTLHLACHARAQNIGAKAAEMLRFIPNMNVDVIERCSGHGGTWGMMEDNFQLALDIGAPVVKQIKQKGRPIFSSECPLAGEHIRQGLTKQNTENKELEFQKMHPLEIFARAYSLDIG